MTVTTRNFKEWTQKKQVAQWESFDQVLAENITSLEAVLGSKFEPGYTSILLRARGVEIDEDSYEEAKKHIREHGFELVSVEKKFSSEAGSLSVMYMSSTTEAEFTFKPKMDLDDYFNLMPSLEEIGYEL